MPLRRRGAGRFLLRILLLVAPLVLALVFGFAISHQRMDSCADLGDVAEFPRGSVTLVSCVPAYVVGSSGNPVVLFARSPHLPNEPLEWDPERQLFVSTAHGEAFDLNGRVVNGPAVGDMWECPSEVRAKDLFIVTPSASPTDFAHACYGSSAPPW